MGNAVSGPANARPVVDVDFDIDRRGWGIFARLSGRHQQGVRGRSTAPVTERHGYWRGAVVSPQRFLGLGARVGGTSPVTARNAEIGDVRSADYDDPALRIFRDRAARRRL